MNIDTPGKQQRQHRLLALVAREEIPSQEHLRRRLAACGIRVTQATLSRDMRELGLVRTPQGYKAVAPADPALPPPPPLSHLLQEFVREVREAEQLLVLKTNPGSAQAVAASLDRQKWPEIAGTIAGDDTILVVVPTRRARRQLRHRLETLIKG